MIGIPMLKVESYLNTFLFKLVQECLHEWEWEAWYMVSIS